MDINKILGDLIENSGDGIYFVDTDRKLKLWNKAAERITGYTASEVLGSYCQDNILYHIDGEGCPLCIVGCPLYSTLGDGQNRSAEVFLRHKDGHRVAVQVTIFPVYDNGKIIGAFEMFTPKAKILESSKLVDDLTDRVMNDDLTGLPNRTYLEHYIDHKIEEFKRFGRKFCVVFLDLDNFGNFNNDYGHTAGDNALRAIASSFLANLRDNDIFGRWGGEEFVGVFSVKTTSEAFKMGEKSRVLVKGSEIDIDGERKSLTASIGVSVVRPGDTIDALIDRADRMMYMSKKRTKNCITVENPEDTDHPFMTEATKSPPAVS